jgi:nucleoid DNA-binding protein
MSRWVPYQRCAVGGTVTTAPRRATVCCYAGTPDRTPPRRVVHKRQLIAEVARRTSLTQPQVQEALGGILEVVAKTMAAGDVITLVGFGRFEANEHRPRTVQGRDGKTCHVEGRLVPSFRPYPSLRRRVQGRAAASKSEGDE